MRILFLSHYFPPEVNAPATRTFEHCQHWVRQGHKVTVISCVPHQPMGKVYPGYKNRFFQFWDYSKLIQYYDKPSKYAFSSYDKSDS